MKITGIDTFRFEHHANVLIVRLRTDEGLVGIGETFYGAAATEAYIHTEARELLLGVEADDPNRVIRRLVPYVGYQGAGAETRARSAIDIALWDLLGRASGLPLSRLLGGAVRDDIAIYNTCAGSDYVQGPGGQSVDNWGLDVRGSEKPSDRYEDLEAFLTRPGELAQDLLDEGIGGMKIWPFDPYAERHGGTRIERGELQEGVGIVEAIRDAVGDQMDVMIELHGLWNLPEAQRIVHALEDLDITWVEDPLRADQPDALATLARGTRIPIAGGETVVGARAFRRLLEREAFDVPIVDPTWAGGISEAARIATVADTFGKPIAAHDCTGPISLAVCCHLSVSQPNALVQETVRAFYRGWYDDIVTQLPSIEDGRIAPPPGPGLGLDLVEDLGERPGVTLVSSGR